MKLENHSIYSDSSVRALVEFILEGGRLPATCSIKIVQGRGWGRGRAWGASETHWARRRGTWVRLSREILTGGRILIRAPDASVARKVGRVGGRGGYLPRVWFGSDEAFFAILAHEIRHVFQGPRPRFRECRTVRRHRLGTNGKLDEVDATLFETRALRRWRRAGCPGLARRSP